LTDIVQVVQIASEMLPLAKTGGLGDVCGSLPLALESVGCKCTAFLPAYRSALRSGLAIEATNIAFTIPLAGRNVACKLLRTTLPHSNVVVYLIDQPHYFERDGLYSDAQGEYRDNCERYSFFCRAAMHAIDVLGLQPNIVHCHDWQAGLVPVYMHAKFGNYAWMQQACSMMTIHNLAYQGRFWHLDMPLTGLDWSYFNWEQLEYYGDLNLMKGGIVFADRVTTVSPTYAKEITHPEHGCGLDNLLAKRGTDLVGIVNGVDYELWNPTTDQLLPTQYDQSSWMDGKRDCKAAIQSTMNLPQAAEVPLVGIVSRLASQKGWDLIIPLLREWLPQRDVQWVILGTGDKNYEKELSSMALAYPTKLAVRLEFSEAVAHGIEAGSDMFLMPSRYEPCGLNQLYSLKYGTVPVVHTTGGLADTVVHASDSNLQHGIATGFQFSDYSVLGLEQALNEALDFYLNRRSQWAQLVETGMRDDWSWKNSARQYREIYLQTLQQRSGY
jgi:starch synthase